MLRSFKNSLIIFTLTVFAISCDQQNNNSPTMPASTNTTELPSLKDKKVLIVHGGWEGHKPDVYAEKASALLQAEGATVTLSDSLAIYANEAVMSDMDLIIQSVTMSDIAKEEIEGLQKAVKNGAGFAGSHGGFCDSFRNNTAYQYMTGGQFVAHPGGQVDYTVNITDQDDPITRGILDFPTHTEQYYIHIDPNVQVLATTTFSGEHDENTTGAVMPVIWKKHFGKGRIFCITIGHDPAEFDFQPAQQLLMNGFRWASGSKYLPKENLLDPAYQFTEK